MLSARAPLIPDDNEKKSCLSKAPKTYTYSEINSTFKQQKFEPLNEVIVTFETLDGRAKALEKFVKVKDE